MMMAREEQVCLPSSSWPSCISALVVATGDTHNNRDSHDDAVGNAINDFIVLRVQDGRMAQDSARWRKMAQNGTNDR
jgi:hypothetical protein